MSTQGGKKVVKKLKAKACMRFADKIMCRRNFSEKWTIGADSMCTSHVHNHANRTRGGGWESNLTSNTSLQQKNCHTQSIQRFVSLKYAMEFKSFHLTEKRMQARISCTIMSWQNGKCSPRPSSLLTLGSTDKDNVDKEVLLAVWCDPDGSNEKVLTGIIISSWVGHSHS